MERQVLRQRIFALICVLILTSQSALADEESSSSNAKIDPQARDIVNAFGRYHAKLNSWRLRAEICRTETVDGVVHRKNAVLCFDAQRPNRVLYTIDPKDDPETCIRLACDGRTLSLYVGALSDNYAVVRAPTTWRQMLRNREVRIIVGTKPVFVAMLSSDPAASLLGKLESLKYRGVVTLEGHDCHLIEATQDSCEWQMWIDTGEQPLLRGFAEDNSKAIDRQFSGEPDLKGTLEELKRQLVTSHIRWEPEPEFATKDFDFAVPDGATKMDSLAEISGIPNDLDEILKSLEPQTRDIMETFGEYQQELKHFRMKLAHRSTVDQAVDPREKFTTVAAERPNRLAIRRVDGGIATRDVICDGIRSILWQASEKKYAASHASNGFRGSLIGIGHTSIAEYVLLNALFEQEPLKELLTYVKGTMTYAGEVNFHVYRCHHFEASTADGKSKWQFWFDTGDTPLLRGVARTELRINRAGVEQRRRDEIRIDDWDVEPHFDDETFTFSSPEDATAAGSMRQLFAGPHPLLGKPLPALELSSLDSTPIKLSTFKHKHVVLLDFCHSSANL